MLAGCGGDSFREDLGLLRTGPDAFAVLPNRPIEYPDSDELPLPQPGAPSRVAPDALAHARTALGLTLTAAPTASEAEIALLAMLGADRNEPGIRAQVDAEYEEATEKKRAIDRLFDLEREKYLRRHRLDPAEEVRRLQALGILATRPTEETEQP